MTDSKRNWGDVCLFGFLSGLALVSTVLTVWMLISAITRAPAIVLVLLGFVVVSLLAGLVIERRYRK